MKTETFFEEVTEKWGSGCVTAMKSGLTLHVIVPKSVERELGIANRDRVFIKICKAGDKKTAKDHRFKNLSAKETIDDINQLERDFIKAYREYGEKVLESAYGTIGKYRTDELIKKFGTKKEQSYLPTMLDAETDIPTKELKGVEENELESIEPITEEIEVEQRIDSTKDL